MELQPDAACSGRARGARGNRVLRAGAAQGTPAPRPLPWAEGQDEELSTRMRGVLGGQDMRSELIEQSWRFRRCGHEQPPAIREARVQRKNDSDDAETTMGAAVDSLDPVPGSG